MSIPGFTKGRTLTKKRRKRPQRSQSATPASSAASPGHSAALRYYTTVILCLAAVAVLLQILSLGPLKVTFWGFHFYAFIPLPIAIVNWAVLAAAAAMLLGRSRLANKPVAVPRLLHDRPIVAAVFVALVFTAIFYALRSQQSLLGDAHPLMVGLPGGESFHPRQPLTMWIQQHLYHGLGGLFRRDTLDDEWVAFKTTAVGSVILGFFFVLIACALGRTLSRGLTDSKITPWLITLILLGQGYALLFFGYVENYTIYTVFVGLYLLTALIYLRGQVTIQLVVVVFFLSLGLHLSTLGLLPSLLFLIAYGLQRPNRRTDAALGVVVAVACALVLNWLLGAMSPGFSLWKGLAGITKTARTAQGGGVGLGYIFSWQHIRDFLNEHFLLGPLAAFFFLPALGYAVARRQGWNATAIFLTLAAGSYLAGSFAMSEPLLGYARDWDLFAPAAVCYVTAGLYFLLAHTGNARLPRLLAFAAVFSFLQLAPYVRITHSQQLSLERFKYLPLGFGRTEVVVGNWYYRTKQYDQAEIWFKRALEVYQYNANAYGLLGTIYSEQERWDAATIMFHNAAQLRPDKPAFHNNLARSLMAEERYAEALPELEWLVKRDPEAVGYWRAFKRCYLALGQQDKAADVNRQLLGFVMRELQKDPNHVLALLEAGILLSELGQKQEALVHCRRALELAPDHEAGLFNTAMILTEVGRAAEARPLLERFLELYPEHSHADWARQQLGR